MEERLKERRKENEERREDLEERLSDRKISGQLESCRNPRVPLAAKKSPRRDSVGKPAEAERGTRLWDYALD